MWAILGCLKPVFGSSQRVTLVVTNALKIFGRWQGPTNNILSVSKCSFSS